MNVKQRKLCCIVNKFYRCVFCKEYICITCNSGSNNQSDRFAFECINPSVKRRGSFHPSCDNHWVIPYGAFNSYIEELQGLDLEIYEEVVKWDGTNRTQ